MSSTASINVSGALNQMTPNGQQENQHVLCKDDKGVQRGQLFHVAGTQPCQVTYMEEPCVPVNAPGPKLAFSASNYPPNAQQQQYQQQFQMQPEYQLPEQVQIQPQYQPQPQQYQQQQQFQQQPQYQQQQQYQPQQQYQTQPQFQTQPQYQPQQQYQLQQQYQPQPQQTQTQQQYQYQQQQQQQQPMYQQDQYQPHEQYEQQYTQPPDLQYQPIQMVNVQQQMTIQGKDLKKMPVFEVPVSKIQMVKKNQSAPPKPSTQNMQQSFRSSRSGSFSAIDDITDPPRFLTNPEPHQHTTEGDPVSVTARVSPAGDSNLSVQWYKDGQPLSAGSRFNTSFERGFAVLEILYTFKEDAGEYSCVAKNNFGMDQTSPSQLSVTMDDNVAMHSHLPREMADNIAAMEANLNAQRLSDDRYETPRQQPKFIRPMPGLYKLNEGQSVHLETIFVPINDSALVIEWFKNGMPLNNGCRFNMISDRGFSILDIIGLIPDDAGQYFCVATNSVGKAQSNVVKLEVSTDVSVITTSQLPQESVQHLQALDSNPQDDIERPDFQYEESEEVDSPPHFDISPHDIVIEEGHPAKFLVKVSGYPRPRIQWLFNDSLAVTTSTQRIFNDGSISYFEFHRCKHIGQSNILIIAKNKHGESTADATLTVLPSDDFRPELKRVDPDSVVGQLRGMYKITFIKREVLCLLLEQDNVLEIAVSYGLLFRALVLFAPLM